MGNRQIWSRVIRDLSLKRNRIRTYPAKPKVGIWVSAPSSGQKQPFKDLNTNSKNFLRSRKSLLGNSLNRVFHFYQP